MEGRTAAMGSFRMRFRQWPRKELKRAPQQRKCARRRFEKALKKIAAEIRAEIITRGLTPERAFDFHHHASVAYYASRADRYHQNEVTEVVQSQVQLPGP